MAQLAILAVMAVGAMNKGAQERKLAYHEAQGLRDAGNRRMAAATAEVAEGERLKEHMYSRALALSADSGGGTDAGMVNLLGDLNAEGDYRIFSKLYVGADEAMGLQFQSQQAMRAGDAALEAGYVNAAKTVLNQYGNYGAMWDEAKTQFAAVKGATWDKMSWSHAGKARSATISSSTTRSGYGGYHS